MDPEYPAARLDLADAPEGEAMRFLKHRRGERLNLPRGAATVELALVLPLLVFLFVVAVDFGRYFYFSTIVSNCARNGALYLSQPDLADQTPYRSAEAAALADAADLKSSPRVTATNGVDSTGRPYVEVTVDYTFQTVSRFPGIGRDWPIVRKVRMRTTETSDDDS